MREPLYRVPVVVILVVELRLSFCYSPCVSLCFVHARFVSILIFIILFVDFELKLNYKTLDSLMMIMRW